MVEILFCALVGLAIANIAVNGSILSFIRVLAYKVDIELLKELINCMMCSGFWTGVLTGSVYFFAKHGIVFSAPLLGCIVATGLLSSLFSDLYSLVRDYLEEARMNQLKDESINQDES